MRTVHPIWYRWLKSRVWLTAYKVIIDVNQNRSNATSYCPCSMLPLNGLLNSLDNDVVVFRNAKAFTFVKLNRHVDVCVSYS